MKLQRMVYIQGIIIGFMLGDLLSSVFTRRNTNRNRKDKASLPVVALKKSFDETHAALGAQPKDGALSIQKQVQVQPGGSLRHRPAPKRRPKAAANAVVASLQSKAAQPAPAPAVPFKVKPKSPRKNGEKLAIAVVMCINSKTIKSAKILETMSISKLMLPSLKRTIEPEKYNYTIYLGMDDDDKYWMTPAVQKALRNQAGPSLPIVFRAIPNKQHRIPFNEILNIAYDMGSDYMVRINDDSEFITGNWTTYAVDTLLTYDPPNLGVVGPTCAEGNAVILTHDMVHRTHMEVHNGEYYPAVFNNWWLDDWITWVYVPRRMTKLANWVVKHHTNHHGTRYKVNPAQGKLLGGELKNGKARITKHLIDTKYMTEGESMASTFDIVVTVNDYQLEIFLNWWAHYIKLPDNKRSVVYVVAQNQKVYDILTTPTVLAKLKERRAVIEWGPMDLKTTNAKQTKSSHISRHMLKGRNVVFCEVDVIWKADPFLHLPSSPRSVDMYLKVDSPSYSSFTPYVDDAFVIVTANTNSAKLMMLWNKRMWTAPTQGTVILNDIVKNRKALVSKELEFLPLSTDKFPNGRFYFGVNTTAEQRAKAVVVHNNYAPAVANPKNFTARYEVKKQRLIKYDLWEPFSIDD